jgi:hypothetical protein
MGSRRRWRASGGLAARRSLPAGVAHVELRAVAVNVDGLVAELTDRPSLRRDSQSRKFS